MTENTLGVFLPRYFIGPDAYAQAAKALAPLGKRILLIGGEKALVAGRQALAQALEGSPVKIAGVHIFHGECTLEGAKGLAELAGRLQADLIAGMGGGKAIDTAKACAHLAGLPAAAFPTIAATCAAVTKLSVMYHADGAFDRFLFLNAPPVYAFLHTGILAQSPAKYLRAGMGDAIAKHFESTFSARGEALAYADSLGLAVSRTCYEPLLASGPQALRDCEGGQDSQAFREAVQCVIVSTGLVSLLVKECFNGALAHSLYYAMENLPAIRKCLHGDVVAWGTLVQLLMDGRRDKAIEAAALLKALGTPLTLGAMGLSFPFAGIGEVLESAVGQPDMAHLPYPVTPAMVLSAMAAAENLDSKAQEGGVPVA